MFSVFNIEIISQYLISIEEFVFLIIFLYWSKLLHNDIRRGNNGLSKAMLFFVAFVLLASSFIQFLAILLRLSGFWNPPIIFTIVFLRLAQKSIALIATIHFMKVYRHVSEIENVHT